MKKSILGLAALALLASCNNDEELNSLAPEAITFGNPFVDNATRAIDNTYTASNFKSFKVYASAEGNAGTLRIFDGTEVTGAVGTALWDYTGKQYWIPNVNYKFVGVKDATVKTYANELPTQLTVNSAYDVLVATAERNQGATIDPNAVDMTFEHILSKVHFTVNNNIATNSENVMYTYKVSNIKITNANVGGTYNIAGKTWDTTMTQGTLDFGNASNATAAAAANTAVAIGAIGKTASATSHNSCLLIPGTYESLTVSFDWELSFNGTPIVRETGKTASITNQKFVASHAYNININFNLDKPIEFTVKESDKFNWTPGEGGGNVNL